MRLTLRTMLAYLDDILEPSDATEVGKKIEESEFATSLMHRTRDVVRRLRLAAPKLEGRGIGLDPNTVAEYLDNTLPSEKVPEFEKVCLESDVHLAEVASAHQILTLVLGEPAEIDPSARQRMYSLGAAREQAAAKAPVGANGATGGQATAAAPRKRSRKRSRRRNPQVPGYLRETSTGPRKRYLLAAALLLAVIGVGAVLMVSPPDSLRPWRDSLVAGRGEPDAEDATGDNTSDAADGKEGVIAESNNDEAAADPDLSKPDDSDADGSDADGRDSDDSDSDDSDTGDRDSDDSDADEIGEPVDGAQTDKVAAARARSTSDQDNDVDDVSPSRKPAGAKSKTAGAKAGATGAKTKAAADRGRPSAIDDEELTMPGDDASDAALAADADSTVEGSADDGPEPPLPSDEPLARPGAANQSARPSGAPVEDEAADAGEGIGRLITEQEALLRFDRKKNQWARLPARATVYANDALLALPTFRPNVALGAGVTMQILGGASVIMEPPDAQGVPGVTIKRGRVILLSAARPDSQVRLQFANRQGTLIFGKDDATVAIEVAYWLPDGVDPEAASANVSAELYVASGTVRWLGGPDSEIESISAPAQRSLLVPVGAPAGDVVLPAWLASRDMNRVEKDASQAVEEEVNPDRPVTLALKELVGHRRLEISLLALKCLAQINEFDAFVPVLNDPTQRTAWSDQIDSLRAALARDPAVAGSVRKAFESQRGPKGLDLYRMLWGYGAQDLEGGAATRLVKLLDHQDLDFRVLAFWNLHHITGFSLYYRPEYNDARRRQYLQKWQQKLDAGLIVPKEPAG